MEIKRAAELVICSLLREALPGLLFYPSEGGGDDFTPPWLPTHIYIAGNLLRPTSSIKTHAVIVTTGGTSGATEPNFNDVVGSTVTAGATFKTLSMLTLFNSEPQPPFAVVMIDKADKVLPTEETSLLTGRITWITRMSQTDTLAHTTSFKQIYDTVTQIGKGFDVARSMMIHGIDITSTEESNDDARQGRGDAILFTMGVTEI